jgi:hypothetical protein
LFGSGGLKETALNMVVAGLAIKEKTWIRLFNDVRQPPLLVTKYRMDGDGAIERKPTGIEEMVNAVKEPAEVC